MLRKVLLVLFLVIIVGAVVAGYAYKAIFNPNVNLKGQDSALLHVKTGSSYEALKNTLVDSSFVEDMQSFERVSALMKFSKPKAGQYLIKNGMSNKELVSMLRSGRQKPIDLTFNNMRTIDDLIGHLSSKLELDSASLSNYLLDKKVLDKLGYNKLDILTLFIPNTYQFFWNTSPEKLIARLKKEHDKFYTKDREQKLAALGLNKKEVYTLASIVQKETLVGDEKPTVAGVYINRLKRGQLLQADPTVVYANGDFGLRRVLNKHLAIDSPYNTYKYAGLPPGPICMPDVSTIDAVLNYKKHKYLYFCANTDNSGRHVFARTLIEHNRNANKYRAYLNKSRIYK